MLIEQSLARLRALKLNGMADALARWRDDPGRASLEPADLVGLLADAEWSSRESRKLSSRLRRAHLRITGACIEDIDLSRPRGISRQQLSELASCSWIARQRNLVITGSTGTGKSYIACALANSACRLGHTTLYRRASRLFDEAAHARADGSWPAFLVGLSKVKVLVLDDFGLEPLGAAERKTLLEIIDDRYGVSSTILTSQLEPKLWHGIIGDPTFADAIADRLVHNADRLALVGESGRKLRAQRS
jgi:DNA replication protein DnaC